MSGSMAAPTLSSRLKEKIPEEYIPAIKVGAVCAALLAVVLVLTKMNIAQFKKRYDAVVDIQGAFVDMTPDEIQARIIENQNKLKNYKNAYQASDMAFMLTHIAKILPTGIWLTKMEIQYVKDKETSTTPSVSAEDPSAKAGTARAMTAELGGYAYTDNANEQFKMVYGLVNMLKLDVILKKYSQNINLTAIQSEQQGDIALTSFKIQVK